MTARDPRLTAVSIRVSHDELAALQAAYPHPWTQSARAILLAVAGEWDRLTEPEALWCRARLAGATPAPPAR